MKPPTKQSSRHVEAVLAALDILDCFLEKPALTLKQIVDLTGFTRNRVMRLTGTLQFKGYLLKDKNTGEFTLASRIMALGKVFERNYSLISFAKPILKELSQKTGESVSVYVREGLKRVVLLREEGTHAIRFAISEGERMELYAGAGGKVILAFAPEKVKQAVLEDNQLTRLTKGTIIDRSVLVPQLKKIRKLGYSTSHAERVPDSGAVAAPVFGADGLLAGALGIAGPISRFVPETLTEKIELVVAAAKQLSKLLGGEP